jgi:hypothetical protein
MMMNQKCQRELSIGQVKKQKVWFLGRWTCAEAYSLRTLIKVIKVITGTVMLSDEETSCFQMHVGFATVSSTEFTLRSG